MPRGASAQREKEFEKFVGEFHQEHRYCDREDEVAARIVNKQRAQHGETKGELEADRKGESPDRILPVGSYDKLDVDQIVAKIDELDVADVKKIKTYEANHNNRTSLLETIDRRLQ